MEQILKLTHNRYLIGGAKGIGKSVLSVLLVGEFLNANHVVVYQWEGRKHLLIGTSPTAAAKSVVSQTLETHGYQNVVDSGVYDLDAHRSVFLTLTNATHIVHIIDFDNDALVSLETAPTGGDAYRIVVSSPNDARLKKFCEEPHAPIYIPPWGEEEILEMMEKLNGGSLLDEATVEQVKEKYGWVGGTPRWVCEHTAQQTMAKINNDLALVTKEMLEQYFFLSYGTIPKLSTGVLLHVVPQAEAMEGEQASYKHISDLFDLRIASPYLSRRLLRHWRSQSRFSARVFLDASFGAGLKGGLRGYILEEAAHASVCDGGHFRLAPLNANGAGSTDEINWPRIQNEVEFDTREMSDLLALAPYIYARSTQSNVPSIDSFCVMAGDVLFGITGWCLVASQMTMAKKTRDVTVVNWLRKIRTRVLILLQQLQDQTIAQQVAANPVVLMFVVDKDVEIKKAQDLVTTDGKLYCGELGFHVVQFRLQLDSVFEETARKVKE